jgi:tetratricopeptide (TPR) repeat protein
LQLQPNNPDVIAAYGWAKYAMERSKATSLTSMDTKEYEQLLQKSISLVSDTVDRYRARLADLYFGTQRYRKAMDQYARTIQIRGSYQGDPNIQDDILFLQLARCFYQLEQNDKAASYALTAVRINPQNQEAKDLFYEIWTGGTKDK